MNKTKLYYNGDIYTVEEDMPFAEAMAVSGDKIVGIGVKEEVLAKLEGKEIEYCDLQGKFLMPGFVEAHAHPVMAGPEILYEVNLASCKNEDECVESVKNFYEKNPNTKMIRGAGWVNPMFDSKGPRKELLDKVSKDIPIIMVSGDHHSIWVNSKAMEIAGVNKDTEDVIGGVIERDDITKEPLGTFREEAQPLIQKIIQPYSIEECDASMFNYQKKMAEYGITMAHDAWLNVNSNPHKSLGKMAEEEKLMFKISASMYTQVNDLDYIDEIIRDGKKLNKNAFTVNHAKFFIDGVVEGNTAWLKEPYANNPDYCGEPLWEKDALTKALKKLDDAGWWSHLHVIGDAAIEQVLDCMEEVIKINGKKERRNIITHAQLVDPKDIPRIKETGFTIVANPYWFMKEEGYYYKIEEPLLGSERASKEYPMKSLFDTGIVVASASDFSVTPEPNPLMGMYYGMFRCLPEYLNDPEKILGIEERVTLEEMIRSFTINGAYTMNLEKKTGSLKEGKDADYIILDKNILNLEPEKIMEAKVLSTFSQGKEIFSV